MRRYLSGLLLPILMIGCADKRERFRVGDTKEDGTRQVSDRPGKERREKEAGGVAIPSNKDRQVSDAGDQEKRGKDAESVAKPSNKEPANPKPDFSVTAEAMMKEYIADERSADRKYQDKLVEVTGTVDSVACKHTTGSGRMMLGLAGAKRTFSIVCSVPPEDEHMLNRLFHGQKVKVTGKCSKRYSHSVELYPCVVRELEPSKIIASTAVAVAKEFDSDPKAAADKYSKSEDVILSGTVADVLDDWNERQPSPVVMLKGSDKTRVFVHLWFQDWQDLQKGQEVQFRIQSGLWPSSRKDPPNFPKDFKPPPPAGGSDVYCGGFVIK
jgi:tRNA_anti-like